MSVGTVATATASTLAIVTTAAASAAFAAVVFVSLIDCLLVSYERTKPRRESNQPLG